MVVDHCAEQMLVFVRIVYILQMYVGKTKAFQWLTLTESGFQKRAGQYDTINVFFLYLILVFFIVVIVVTVTMDKFCTFKNSNFYKENFKRSFPVFNRSYLSHLDFFSSQFCASATKAKASNQAEYQKNRK